MPHTPTSFVAWTAALAALGVTVDARASGCEKDTDCKGDRVCESSVCVDPPPRPAPRPVPIPAPANGVHVTLESNEPAATLARITGMTLACSASGRCTPALSTELVCVLPCKQVVDRSARYLIQGVSGAGRSSGSFVLPAREFVTLKVESHSHVGFVLGTVFTGLAGTGLVVGGSFWGVGAATGSEGMAKVGWITTLASVPVLLGSIYLLVHNATDVTTDHGERLARVQRAGTVAFDPRMGGWVF